MTRVFYNFDLIEIVLGTNNRNGFPIKLPVATTRNLEYKTRIDIIQFRHVENIERLVLYFW